MLVGEQVVSLHTKSGVPLYQFLASDLQSLTWTRELCETSRAMVEVPTGAVDDITPWLHWMSVWDADGKTLHWTGPVQRATYRREIVTIEARDVSALLERTRTPLTKAWEATDPALIAAEMWRAVMETHQLRGDPVVRRDPLADPFNFTSTADAQMLDAVMDELVELGLSWSVSAGTVLLGPAPRTSMASLGEDDFINAGLSLVRDGSRVFTDVLLRAADEVTRARVNTAGLNLQTIVDVDSLFGVSNADRAARQYLRYCSRMREAVVLDGAAQLHPEVPLTVDSLIPSVRVTVAAYGTLALMELQSVEVTAAQDGVSVAVGLEAVDDDPPELVKITDRTRA
jgi:hypothetical protein